MEIDNKKALFRSWKKAFLLGVSFLEGIYKHTDTVFKHLNRHKDKY